MRVTYSDTTKWGSNPFVYKSKEISSKIVVAWIQWKGGQGDDIDCWKDYLIVDNIGRNDDLERLTLRNDRLN